MIPQRVKLSGFLSYKDEQEVRFDGSQLWMLSGTNGSGKSSIFDAVTYALFGHHRGGRLEAAELINKESNTLAVEFDFSLDRQLYRIKRTVRRRASSSRSQRPSMRWNRWWRGTRPPAAGSASPRRSRCCNTVRSSPSTPTSARRGCARQRS